MELLPGEGEVLYLMESSDAWMQGGSRLMLRCLTQKYMHAKLIGNGHRREGIQVAV